VAHNFYVGREHSLQDVLLDQNRNFGRSYGFVLWNSQRWGRRFDPGHLHQSLL